MGGEELAAAFADQGRSAADSVDGSAGQRVGILARASNAHSSLTLAVSFLFVLEPVEFMMTDDSREKTEGVEYKLAKAAKTSAPRKGKSWKGSSTQDTLLTLSWQAVTVSMDAITENRTIVWSPKAPSRQFASPTSDESEGMQKLVSYVLARQTIRGAKPYAAFKCVRLLPDSALHTTIAPLSSSIAVGNAVTVCVTVANRSARTDYDLTLVLPSQKEGVLNESTGDMVATPAVVGFEASHRLGLLRPGMSVRRSLHVAFIRLGKCRLSPLVLVDHLTSYLTTGRFSSKTEHGRSSRVARLFTGIMQRRPC